MNGCGIDLHSLADTGANGFLFINRPLAKRLSQSLGTPLRTLPYPVSVGGFDGKTQTSVNQYIRLHLTIDGRRILNCPFIVLDLRHQDVIIRIKWMRRFKVFLDPEHNQLIWPSDTPPTPSLTREIKLPYHSPRVSKYLNHQSDANRRDRKLENEMKWHEKSRLGQIPISVLTAALLAKPNRPRLESEPPPPLPPKKCLRYPKPATQLCNKNKPIVDICQISANALHFNMKRPGIEFF